MVGQYPLKVFILVRVQASQLCWEFQKLRRAESEDLVSKFWGTCHIFEQATNNINYCGSGDGRLVYR